jgi:hypothetical protein
METDEVRALLHRFQEGYTRRDPAGLDEFMELFVPGGELEVIGTNAVTLGQGEWCQGEAAVRELVAGDWEHWGDVRFDVAGARISCQGDVAWLATTGTVTDTISAQECTTGYLDFVEGRLAEQGVSPQGKMLDILGLGTDILLGMQQGERYVWPFRLTAVAVRDEAGWRFHQMHFSFPTTRAPDVRAG